MALRREPPQAEATPRRGFAVPLPVAGTLVALGAGAFLLLFFAWPVAAMIARGFADGAVGISSVLARPRTWRILGQTLAMAAGGTAASVLLGIPGAYVLYRLDFPGRTLARALAAIPFVLPSVVVGMAFRALLGPGGPLAFLGLDQSIAAVIAAMAFFNYSVVVRTVGMVWARLDPRQVQAARTLGASPARSFLTVTLPALGPALAAAASLVFLFCSTAYGIVQTLGRPGYGTLETEIWVQTVTYLDIPAAAGISLLQIAVVMLAVAVQRRLAARSQAALRIGRAVSMRPVGADIPACVLTAGVLLGLLALPLGTLAVRALRSEGAWSLANFRALSANASGLIGGASVADALGTSVRMGLVAALIALAVGVPLAVLLARASRAVGWLDALVMAPLGVSAVTVGFGYFLTMQSPPLDLASAGMLVPVAQSVVALPLVVRAIVPSLRAVPPAQREAAATLGAGPWRVLATIEGPLVARAVPLAAAFACAVSLGEFGATSFLASPSEPTLPVLIVRLLSRPGAHNYAMAMAAAALLAFLTGAIMGVAEWANVRAEERALGEARRR